VKQGYKIFFQLHGKLYGEYVSNEQVRPKRRWLHEKDYRDSYWEDIMFLRDRGFHKYLMGFHVYHSLKDAKARLRRKMTYPYEARRGSYEIWKVKIKEPTCNGVQNYRLHMGGEMVRQNVTVCKQIFIEERIPVYKK